MELTAAIVRELLDYDPETGVLTWRARPARPGYEQLDGVWNTTHAGMPAGCITPYGYRFVSITANFGKEEKAMAHRLAWVHYYGSWPDGDIDHINRVRDDNAITNLRLATRSQNLANSNRRKDNTSGVKGVSYQRARNKWRARLNLDGRQVYYGYFDTKEEAISARQKAARVALGEFANETTIIGSGPEGSEAA